MLARKRPFNASNTLHTMAHFTPEFEPPSRTEWLFFMILALTLLALVVRGAVAFWADIF